MKVSKEKAQENRNALVESASELFLQYGIHGTGVAEISKRAGLTQGAFYRQFGSKSEVSATACRQSLKKGHEVWESARGKTEDDINTFISLYLSGEQLTKSFPHCPMAAYASEISRQEPGVGDAFKEGFENMVSLVQQGLCNHLSDEVARERALTLVTALAGSLMIADAVKMTDPKLSEEILKSAISNLGKFSKLP